MQITGEYSIPADRQTVWQALNDPEVLKACLPGCEEIEKTSETEMTATIVAKVGPVRAKFSGRMTLSDLDPPNGYTLSGEGQGGPAGFASGVAKVMLSGEGAETLLRYDVDAKVGGKLAQIGSRLIDSTAKKLSREFFGALAERLGGAPAEAAPAAEAAAVPAKAPSARKGLPTPVWVAGIIAIVIILILIFSGVI
jgi:carbon monoxide dehydrogenase subunit G